MAEFIAYALVVLNIIIAAAIIWALGMAALWLVRKALRRSPGDDGVSETDDNDPDSAPRRECGKCHRSWVAEPGVELSRWGVWLRLRVRIWDRNHKRPESAWSRQKAWTRCPSCLSTYVFDCDLEAREERRQQRAARRLENS